MDFDYLTKRLSKNGEIINKIQTLDVMSSSKLFKIYTNKKIYVYKEFTSKSGNEIHAYKLIKQNILANHPEIYFMHQNAPKAILMEYLGESFKSEIIKSTFNSSQLFDVLKSLSLIHTSGKLQVRELLKNYPELEYKSINNWEVWTLPMLEELRKKKLRWFTPKLYKKLVEIENKYSTFYPSASSDVTFTHGDPHLDNVFYTKKKTYFIDWEWICIASPLRDFTLFIQDFNDVNLILELKNYYFSALNNKHYNLNRNTFENDFHYYLCDNTMKMISWNIEKYLKGYINEKELELFIFNKIDVLNDLIVNGEK